MITSTVLRPGATVRDALLRALDDAARFNSADVVAPSAILWPDADEGWAEAVRVLRARRPILTLGPFDPEREQGPVPWLRVRLKQLSQSSDPVQQVPIVYLPGISRRELTDTQSLDADHRPLAGIVVMSALFAQRNGTDWSPVAFFKNSGVGLGLDVSSDGATKDALRRSLPRLLDSPVDDLRGRVLNSVDFDKEVVDDPPRQMLTWLDDPEVFESHAKAVGLWAGFRSIARKEYRVDPEADGVLAAGARLGERQGKWFAVWQRFADSPSIYPGVVEVLRRAKPEGMLPLHAESWPQDNDDAEAAALSTVTLLAGKPAAEVRGALGALEEEHGPRRTWVWSKLGMARAAQLVGLLHDLAERTLSPAVGSSVDALALAYTATGWETDKTFIDCLSALPAGNLHLPAVHAVTQALYRPWLEQSTLAFQNAWTASIPVPTRPAGPQMDEPAGTCVMFVDGLRYDGGVALAQVLAEGGLEPDLGWGLAAVPTVTGTCKPAVSPVAGLLRTGPELAPMTPTGAVLAQPNLKTLLEANGWGYIPLDSVGDPAGRGWTEAGDIDKLGHSVGASLVYQLENQVRVLAARVSELLGSGWQRIMVVTDHGWLLLPGQLPTEHLPEHLAVKRKGRCARLSDAAVAGVDSHILPWRWDNHVRIAVTRGINAFEAGKVYEHGGLSLQESVVPVLLVGQASPVARAGNHHVDISWVAFRLKVEMVGAPHGAKADLRLRANDPDSSVVVKPKEFKDDKTSLMADDEHGGHGAFLVVVGSDGTMLASRQTKIPED